MELSLVTKELTPTQTISLRFWKKESVRGPAAVLRSFSDGLKKNNVSINVNPKIDKLKRNVWVLSDLAALKQMIELKKQGKITHLFAGPNLVILPSDNVELIGNKEIDLYFVNSQWTYESYVNDLPLLKPKLRILPAGVDLNYWKPVPNQKNLGSVAIIYNKTRSELRQSSYQTMLAAYGYHVQIIDYGKYTPTQYRSWLRRAKLLVFLGGTESQGIALAESWACNVPTLVKQCLINQYNNQEIPASAAPYLTKETGVFFYSTADLTGIIENWDKFSFSPRKWVLENMTDDVCTKLLTDYINER